jgi:hypothetical protein
MLGSSAACDKCAHHLLLQCDSNAQLVLLQSSGEVLQLCMHVGSAC